MRMLIAVLLLIIVSSGFAFAGDWSMRFKVSADIEVQRISEHVYVHISFSEVPQFGRVASNGVIYVVGKEALLFDTPMDDSTTARLIRWAIDSLHVRVVGFVPNHWHNDCMGGLAYLHSLGIPSYANRMTVEIAKSKGLPVPQRGFVDSLVLHIGKFDAVCRYFGPAHAADNIVVWLPSDSVLFAGCMAKDMQARTLGNLSDAKVGEWPKTIEKVRQAFPSAKVIVPGHGAVGGRELFGHTLGLLGGE
jgi:metallo-beta-lactamase class B